MEEVDQVLKVGEVNCTQQSGNQGFEARSSPNLNALHEPQVFISWLFHALYGIIATKERQKGQCVGTFANSFRFPVLRVEG